MFYYNILYFHISCHNVFILAQQSDSLQGEISRILTHGPGRGRHRPLRYRHIMTMSSIRLTKILGIIIGAITGYSVRNVKKTYGISGGLKGDIIISNSGIELSTLLTIVIQTYL